VGSIFDEEQMVGFQMSLPSGILCNKRWKFVQCIFCVAEEGGYPLSEMGVRGIDLFKIAGESISGWIPSWKLEGQKPTRQPCPFTNNVAKIGVICFRRQMA